MTVVDLTRTWAKGNEIIYIARMRDKRQQSNNRWQYESPINDQKILIITSLITRQGACDEAFFFLLVVLFCRKKLCFFILYI